MGQPLHATPSPKKSDATRSLPVTTFAARKPLHSGTALHRKCVCGGSCEAYVPDASRAEAEADRVADRVLSQSPPSQITPALAKPTIQRQRSHDGGALHGAASSAVHEVLSTPGRPLDAATRQFFEPRLGHDFSRVRVHVDEAAAGSVDAHAFTVGHHVVFGANQYRPGSESGRRLLAHELTHVVQQGGVAPAGGWTLGAPDDSCEREARVAANGIVDHHTRHVSVGTRCWPSIQRDLATPRPDPAPPPQKVLTEEQIEEAIRTNRARYGRKDTAWIQDMVGARATGTWDRRTIQLVARLQEQYGLRKDGKVTVATFEFLKKEQEQERAKLAEWRKEEAEAREKARREKAQDDAAKAALGEILCRTRSTGFEFCGHIWMDDRSGTFTATKAITQKMDRRCELEEPRREGQTLVAAYHSHPEGQGLDFSEDDVDDAEGKKRTLAGFDSYYLINHEGGMRKYIPSGDPVTRRGPRKDLGRSEVICP